MMANVQYDTMIEHNAALVDQLQHSLCRIAGMLRAKYLITEDVCNLILTKNGEPDNNKAARLVFCVADRVKHGSATFYDFLDVLVKADRYFSDIVEKIRKSCARREANAAVEMLKKVFLSMLERLQSEIETNNEVSLLELVNALTLLPESVRKGYWTSVSMELGTLVNDRGEAFEALFCHLKPHFTFLDYQVLECLINHYGSAKLKEDMSAYHQRVRSFKKTTTIQQVIDHEWLSQDDVPSHFSVLKVKVIIPGFRNYTLSQVDSLKRRFCAKLHTSECCLSLSEVKIDGVYWTLPSLLLSNFPSVIKMNGSLGGYDIILYKDGRWSAFDDDKDNDQGGASGLSRKRGNEAENKGDTKRQKQDHGKQAKKMLLKMVDLFEETLLPSRKEKQLHQLQRGRQLARNIQLQYY